MAGEGKEAPPEPAAIRDARKAAGLTQEQAGALVYASGRLWRYWEAGEHRMPPGLWELFQIKARILVGGDA